MSKPSEKALIAAISGGAYKSYLQIEESIPQRMARYLDWAATKYPHCLTPMNVLYKAIMGMARMPALKSAEVERLRSRMQAVKNHLHKIYGRTLISEPGMGVRASVDSNDIVEGPLERAVRRVAAAQHQAAVVSGLVETSKLSSINKSRHADVADALKKLQSPTVLGKLLPRPQEQDS